MTAILNAADQRGKRNTSLEVRGSPVRVSKASASLVSEASVRTRGLPGLHTPATQGSQCERLSTQETAGPSPSMGLFRPQLSGKYLCFLPPSHLAKQTAALSCGKGAEAGGSVVKAQLCTLVPDPEPWLLGLGS